MFQTTAGLEDLYLDREDDIVPGAIQPIVFTNADGERQIVWKFEIEYAR